MTVSTELEQRIYLNRLRRRQEQVTQLRPDFISRLVAATGIQLSDADFLPLEEGDSLTREAFERRKELAPDITWREGTEAHVARTLEALALTLGPHAAYLVGHDCVDTAGVPLVPVAPVVRKVFDHWNRRREDLILVTDGAADGFFLEWDSCYGYQLTTWGRFAEALSQ